MQRNHQALPEQGRQDDGEKLCGGSGFTASLSFMLVRGLSSLFFLPCDWIFFVGEAGNTGICLDITYMLKTKNLLLKLLY